MASIISLIMGVIFGAALVLAGLTDPDKIIGSLRLKDFHVLRTVILAVLVAMVGTWLLGLAEANNLDVKPAVILPLLVGGALVGLGLGLTGFCPVTGLAGAASGRIDAVIAVIGMLLGAHVYVLIDPSVAGPLGKVLSYGQITLPQATGTSPIVWIAPIVAAGSLVLILTRGKARKTEQLNNIDWGLTQNVIGAKSSTFVTDGLEVAGVLHGWKNILFVIAILGLILLQATFWLAHTRQIEFGSDAVSNSTAAAESSVAHHPSPIVVDRVIPFDLTFKHVALVLGPLNIIVVLACVFYSLTILSALIVSIMGELGGLGQISRAFYLSIIMLILLLPWQAIFPPGSFGTIFTPSELARECANEASGTMEAWFFYMRFSGVWALTMLVLILTQWRTGRWTKAILGG